MKRPTLGAVPGKGVIRVCLGCATALPPSSSWLTVKSTVTIWSVVCAEMAPDHVLCSYADIDLYMSLSTNQIKRPIFQCAPSKLHFMPRFAELSVLWGSFLWTDTRCCGRPIFRMLSYPILVFHWRSFWFVQMPSIDPQKTGVSFLLKPELSLNFHMFLRWLKSGSLETFQNVNKHFGEVQCSSKALFDITRNGWT